MKPHLVCAGLVWIGIVAPAWSADSSSIRVQVVDADEQPMDNVLVSLSITSKPAVLYELRTGEDGLALFGDLAGATSYKVTVAKPGYSTVSLTDIELPAMRPNSAPLKIPVTLRRSDEPRTCRWFPAGKPWPQKGDTFYVPVVLAGTAAGMSGNNLPDIPSLAACRSLRLTYRSEEADHFGTEDVRYRSRTLVGRWLNLMFRNSYECHAWLQRNEPPKVEREGITYTLREPAPEN